MHVRPRQGPPVLRRDAQEGAPRGLDQLGTLRPLPARRRFDGRALLAMLRLLASAFLLHRYCIRVRTYVCTYVL